MPRLAVAAAGIVAAGSAAATPTSAAPPAPDLVAATDWMQGIYASPCDSTAVEVLSGGAATGAGFVSVNGVVTIDGPAGRALVFLNCRNAGGGLIASVAQLITVDAAGVRTTYAQQSIPGGSRVISVTPTAISLESAVGTPPEGGCCSAYVRRQEVTVGASGFAVADGALIPAFHRTLTSAAAGDNVGLVTRLVPRTAPCYRWGFTPLALSQPDPAGAIVAPSAEVVTMRLALIHLTGLWIEPAAYVAPDMDAAARAFQAAQGLPVDGVMGTQTNQAVRAALGCPETRAFTAVDPNVLGPRAFGSPAELAAAAARYGREGQSGNPALDDLLFWSRWDGANAFFLGCALRENPSNGVTCSWSGATPLQLVGLTDDPGATSVTSFSILYARTAAA